MTMGAAAITSTVEGGVGGVGMSNVVSGSSCTDVVFWIGMEGVAGGEYDTGWFMMLWVEGTDGVCECRRGGTVRRECRRSVFSGAGMNPVTVDIASIAVTSGS
jgi:hypothetical protein